jgi:hypothetical protein
MLKKLLAPGFKEKTPKILTKIFFHRDVLSVKK